MKKMATKKKKSFMLLFAIISLSLVLITVEFFLTLYGRSLCPEKGCEIAGLVILISKKYLLLFALLYFILLFLLALFYTRTRGPIFRDLLFFLGGSGLFAESIFSLRLLWDLGVLCYFCLAIALLTLITVLTLLFFLHKEALTSSSLYALLMGSLMGLIVTFMITGSGSLRSLNNLERGYLVYTEECPQCQFLLKDPAYTHMEKLHLREVYPLLKVLNLTTLPIVIEKKGDNIIISKPKKSSEATCEPQPQGGLCVVP